MACSFRTSQRQDAKLILQFIRELAVYEKLLDQVTVTKEVLDDRLFNHRTAEVLLILAESKEIGYALYFRNFSTFLGRAGLYLEDLYVRPAYRGRGYGKRLFQEIAKIALQRDCGRLEWACLNWNTPSIDFYRSLGAEPQEEWTIYRLTDQKLRQLAEP